MKPVAHAKAPSSTILPFSNSMPLGMIERIFVVTNSTLSSVRASRYPGPGVKQLQPTAKEGVKNSAISGLLARRKLSTFPVKFVKTDVTKYDDLIGLFDIALKTFGKVDCAISNADILEIENWVNPDLDLKTIKKTTLYISLYTNATNAPQRSPTSKP